MRHQLYSELRTIYETTLDNPHTFRITMKMKDMIDEPTLRRAVDKTMRRYPYFCVRLARTENELFFEDNPAPTPVLHTDEPITIGSAQASEHLLAFSWWKNKIHLEAWHALSDGGGVYHLLRTLLHYYCVAYYDEWDFSADTDVRRADDPVDPAEWDDPQREPINHTPLITAKKWSQPAFQLYEGGIARQTKRCIVYNIRVNESEFMRFNFSNDGSPGTVMALFLARAIARLHPTTDKPIVIGMCVNQRRALRAPLAHQSLVGDVRLPYQGRLREKPFMTQATCFRGMVALQSDSDMVLQQVEHYQEQMRELDGLVGHDARHARCVAWMNELTSYLTATISYVGKVSFGVAEHFVQEFHALPSTALPSSATPLTLELSAVNGSFYVNFMQYFDGDEYLRAFIRELRDNSINYDVLYQEETRYPRMVDLWGEKTGR